MTAVITIAIVYQAKRIAITFTKMERILEQKEEVDYGDEGYGIHVQMKYLCSNEACAQILRGWIMNNAVLSVGEKLGLVSRLPIWAKNAVGEKYPPQVNKFNSKFTKEEMAELDRRLHTVKREK